ncbi:hypothetical protein [Metabacillus kandeliae]|nr:hypothetical protein [Metabacillus kandeliae]
MIIQKVIQYFCSVSGTVALGFIYYKMFRRDSVSKKEKQNQ